MSTTPLTSPPGNPESGEPAKAANNLGFGSGESGKAEFDLDALRLPSNYGATLGVKKALTSVPIGKPSASKFFRVHPGEDWTFRAYILDLKEQGETYVVMPCVVPILGSAVKAVVLHTAVDRGDNPFLIPVVLPGDDGRRNPWHESRAQAVEVAKMSWVRMVANMGAGAFDTLVAQSALSEPAWPTCTPEELFQIAFRRNTISDEEHPVVQSLLGKV